MKNIKKILNVIFFTFLIQVYSQNIKKKLNNKVFVSNIGSICEETPKPDPCAGQQIYLVLKFKNKNIIIREKYISSCGKE